MTLLCRPRGRGNWKLRVLTVVGSSGLRRGALIQLSNGQTLRIVEIKP